MPNLNIFSNKISLLLEGKKTFYNQKGNRLIADENGNLKVIKNGIVYDANEEDFGYLLYKDSYKLKISVPETSDYYIAQVKLISGEYQYVSLDIIGDLKFTSYPQFVKWDKVPKICKQLQKNLSVESVNFTVN